MKHPGGHIVRAIILLMLSSFSIASYAQEILEGPQSRLITRFSFQLLSGGIIIIHGQLDAHTDTLNFILDTGSGGISLDSTTAGYLGIEATPSDRFIRGIGGVKQVSFAMDHTLRLPGLEVKNLDFHVNDYTLLTSVYGMRIDGIIGFSFLRRYVVAIDYDQLMISVYTPGVFKYPKGGYLLKPSFTAIPLQPVFVKDGRSITNRFYFDTGAGLCFLLSQDFAKDSAVLHRKKIMVPTQAEGLGGKRPMMLTVLKEIRLGPYRFRKVPTFVFDDEFNVTSYPQTGGLIGNDLLRRFNVVLNYPEHSIHLLPNNFFATPFDYSYTGLGIYVEDGMIVVDDVMPHSPGEKAGFEVGDVIIGVGNNFSGNIQVYRTMLQIADQTHKIVIRRQNELKVLHLKVRNILRKR